MGSRLRCRDAVPIWNLAHRFCRFPCGVVVIIRRMGIRKMKGSTIAMNLMIQPCPEGRPGNLQGMADGPSDRSVSHTFLQASCNNVALIQVLQELHQHCDFG